MHAIWLTTLKSEPNSSLIVVSGSCSSTKYNAGNSVDLKFNKKSRRIFTKYLSWNFTVNNSLIHKPKPLRIWFLRSASGMDQAKQWSMRKRDSKNKQKQGLKVTRNRTKIQDKRLQEEKDSCEIWIDTYQLLKTLTSPSSSSVSSEHCRSSSRGSVVIPPDASCGKPYP